MVRVPEDAVDPLSGHLSEGIMSTSPARARVTRRLVALALPAVALLAGCSSGEQPAAAPVTSATVSSSAASPPASPTASDPSAASPSATGAADAPTCPDAATLAAVAPSQAPGVQLTDPTCSGPWAVVGISGPAPGPVVQLFRYTDGAWQPTDRDAACAAGELPADIEPGVCQAG